MSFMDYGVIALYFIVVMGFGFWFQKRASQNLDAYYLGNKSMPWLALAMSGSVSNFDITGTMWIVSMLFLLGMKSMWIHWMWGWMMGAFFLAYMGKWVRRSGVMTGAEWMITRFGSGPGGVAARMAAALTAVVLMCAMVGYDFQGIGKFSHVYIPSLSANALAILIFIVTTLYVLAGGLYSVVVTDVIQTIFVTAAAIVIAVIAYQSLSPEMLQAKLPADWASPVPQWRVEHLAGTENAQYELLGALVIVWVVKGVLLNAGGPGGMYEFQRFLAARDARDAAKVGAAWSVFMIVRWAMAMGITLLALVGLSETVFDSEEAMPLVLSRYLPVGLKGLVISGLLAAFMSTFSSTLNSGASYLVRDFWQAFIRPNADQRHYIRASYAATVLIMVVGIVIGLQVRSIAQIWNWISMVFGAGLIIPNVLRWYWWRFNGWGYACGTLAGMVLALIPPIIAPDAPMYVVFPPIVVGSLLACIAGAWLTPQVDAQTLSAFYAKVRPFGFWGPVRRAAPLSPEARADTSERPWRAAVNVLLGIVAITGAYLCPMYLVGHWHARAAACAIAAAAAIACLAWTWYRHLPPRGD